MKGRLTFDSQNHIERQFFTLASKAAELLNQTVLLDLHFISAMGNLLLPDLVPIRKPKLSDGVP
jgi:hypothetical protein